MAKKTAATKKRVVKIDGTGQAHVYSSFNNIIVTITNAEGRIDTVVYNSIKNITS